MVSESVGGEMLVGALVGCLQGRLGRRLTAVAGWFACGVAVGAADATAMTA
jgi:Mg/Co/Ni transporter MgtE